MSKLTLKRDFVPYPEKQDELRQLANDYKKLIVTPATFEEAKKARKTLRDERYNLQKIEKSNNGILNDLKGQNKILSHDLIGIIRPVEDRIDEQIKAIEKKKADEKAAKEREKQEQMAAWAKKAQDILSYTDRLVNPKGIVDVQNIIKEVGAIEVNESLFGAYCLIAEQNKSKILEQADTVLERLMDKLKQEQEDEKRKYKEATGKYKDYFHKDPPRDDTIDKILLAIEKDRQERLDKLAELEKQEQKKEEEERKYKEAVAAYKDYFNEEAPKELSTHGILKAIEQDKQKKLAKLAEMEKKEEPIDVVVYGKDNVEDYVLSLAHKMINLHPDMTLDEALKIDPKTMEAVIKRKTSLLDAVYNLGDILSGLRAVNGTKEAIGHIQAAIDNLNTLV